MSCGSLSQFSPNLQQPAPTTATLSRMASFFIAISSAERCDLPVVVGRTAGLVNLAEAELDRKIELHLFRIRIGHLQIETRALDVGDRSDQRGIGDAGEVVEGEGLHLDDLVGQPDLNGSVIRVAAVADPLRRVLQGRAPAAAKSEQAQGGGPVAK